MTIRSVRAKNFRSFKSLDVEFGPLTVLVGANASGKSNLVQIFRFLRDLVDSGIEDAVSLQGGAEFLRNVRASAEDLIEIELSSENRAAPFFVDETAVLTKSTYSCAVDVRPTGVVATIPKEELILDFEWSDPDPDAEHAGQIQITKGKSQYEKTTCPSGSPVLSRIAQSLEVFLGVQSKSASFAQDTLLASSLSILFTIPVMKAVSEIAVFDINPNEPKLATTISGKAQLEPDANNLAIVLNKLFRKPESKRTLLNILSDVLPFVSDIEPERYSDGSIFFGIAESYTPNVRFPAHLLSDGTVNLVALIVALFFEERRLLVIEEPERSIHPALISKLMAMISDASRRKQIILTTHSPEIVRHVSPESLVLLFRDAAGFSRVERPANDEDVRTFLANDIGIGDLYVQDLLSPQR